VSLNQRLSSSLPLSSINSILELQSSLNPLETDFGLELLVDTPTHCSQIIDKFFTNRPDIFHVDVFASLNKTKHQVVYVTTSNDFIQKTANGRRKQILFYDLQPQYIDALRYHLGVFDWSTVTSRDYDVETMYINFWTLLRHICTC
jgi:hypothetical protein